MYFSLLQYMDYMERNKSNQSIYLLYRTLHAIIKINNIDLDIVKIQGLIKRNYLIQFVSDFEIYGAKSITTIENFVLLTRDLIKLKSTLPMIKQKPESIFNELISESI